MQIADVSQVVGTLLQDPERQIVASNVYNEIAFGPENLGVPREEILARVEGALKRLKIEYLRERETFNLSGGEKQKVALAGLLAMNAPIAAIGLDSAEVGNPPAKFERLFAKAREAGLRLTAHAGEEGPPSYIIDALDILGVERIDHGIRCMEDPELVERLVADRIPLTVCPLSNVRLRAVDTLADHPLPAMLAAGLNVSVNSDDPAYFGGYVDDNFSQLKAVFDVSDFDRARLAANSIHSSFASEERKAELLDELNAG